MAKDNVPIPIQPISGVPIPVEPLQLANGILDCYK